MSQINHRGVLISLLHFLHQLWIYEYACQVVSDLYYSTYVLLHYFAMHFGNYYHVENTVVRPIMWLPRYNR
jgi:hypothetical protein